MRPQGAKVALILASAAMSGFLPMCTFHFLNWAMWEGRLGDFQKTLWNGWYQVVMHMAPVDEFAIMNWGLGEPTHACARDAAEKPQANMYLELASLADFKGRVLEVGSGRGGGANTLAKCRCPKEYIGVDLNAKQAAAAQVHFGKQGSCPLSFMEGDAENLPLAHNSVDVVLSVETSHTYPHFPQFVKEVYRVLRPGGTFHITDFRDPEEIDMMIQDISHKFGPPVKLIDISERVAQALDVDIRPEGGRRKLVASLCPSFMIPACLQFIGASAMDKLQNKTKVYTMALFHKGTDAVDVEGARLPSEEPSKLANFVWTGNVYVGVYLVSAVWSMVLENLSGITSAKRPLTDYLLIMFNVALVFCNVVGLCYALRNNKPADAFCFLGFFFLFDIFLYSVHRLFHAFPKTLFKPIHSVHHRRCGTEVVAIDLFYMHPIDCVLQFLVPIDLAFWIAGIDVPLIMFAGCISVIYNTMAHSRLFAYDHLKHHSHEAVSFGIGIFMDRLLGTAHIPLKENVLTWSAVVVAYYMFHLVGAWIAVLPVAYMAFQTVKVMLSLGRSPSCASSVKT